MDLKNIENFINDSAQEDADLLTNPEYVQKSFEVVSEALKNGGDVMQLSDGTIIVTKVETYHLHYVWDAKQGKMVRLKSQKNQKPSSEISKDDIALEVEEAIEQHFEEAY